MCDGNYHMTIGEARLIYLMILLMGYIWGNVNIVDALGYSRKWIYRKYKLEGSQERGMIRLEIFWFGFWYATLVVLGSFHL